jgi:hypothetical protein
MMTRCGVSLSNRGARLRQLMLHGVLRSMNLFVDSKIDQCFGVRVMPVLSEGIPKSN